MTLDTPATNHCTQRPHLLAVAPALLPLPPGLEGCEQRADMVGEHNPYGLVIFHHTDPGPHDCRPRMQADCAGCNQRYVLCGACPSALGAIRAEPPTWTCCLTLQSR